MADRDRLIELLNEAEDICNNTLDCDECEYNQSDNNCIIELITDYLLANGVIVPPCKVGDVVYFLLEDDFPVHRWFLSEEKITEICSKGFFTSAFYPAKEDFGNYTSYELLGKEAFLTQEEAEQALKEIGKEDEGK